MEIYPSPLGLTQYQACGGIPTGRDASSFCFSSKDILFPATRRWWFSLARFILANCQAAAPAGSACRK